MPAFPSLQRQHKLRLRRVSLVLPAILLLLFAALPYVSHGAGEAQTGNRAARRAPAKPGAWADDFLPGTVLVRFSGESQAAKAARGVLALSTRGRAFEARLETVGAPGDEIVDGLRVARVPADETLSAVEALRARPDVIYAEPNYLVHKMALPNDPSYGQLWGLNNSSHPNADVDAEQAWDVTTGSRDVVVGVIDEGVDVSHPDLAANVWANPGEVAGNGFDDDGDGFVDDVHGWDFFHNDASVYDGPGTNPDGSPVDAHGTHVAGTIGAVGNNAQGVVGVNWQVSLMSLKFLGPNGTGTTADAVRAYSYARAMRQLWESSGGARGANVRVLNNSYGGRGRSQAAEDAIRSLSDAGILFVVAAGNDARDNDRFPVYPANYVSPNLVSVGAAGFSALPSTQFSNYGRRTVDLIAPGENILSTTPGNTYDYYYGTSMATPHAAGAAALVCARYPNTSMRRLRAALVYGGAPGITQITNSDKRVSARGALDAAAEDDTTPPAAVVNLQAASQGYQRYNLQWAAPGDDGAAGASVAAYEVRYSDADPGSSSVFERATRLLAPAPAAPGLAQSVTVAVPFRHAAGFIGVRALDSSGNAGPVAVVPLSPDVADADPYVVTTSGAEPLSTGGTPLNLRADDNYQTYQLPFDFNFFGTTRRGIIVSTNGALHFSSTSQLPNGEPDVDASGVDYLGARTMIAGLWDDLRTDRRAGDDVYVVRPDPNRVIFRWQAVTYDTPYAPGATRGENPVGFEIELRRDGTVITRYGDGNHNLFPVVGVSGGTPDPYVVESHTSELALKDLGGAQTVTFAPRRPTPPPTVDLYVGVRTSPEQAASGQPFTYIVVAGINSSTIQAEQTVVVDQLPAGTTFVSCTTTRGTCAGPPVGSAGTVTARIGTLIPNFITSAEIAITVQVDAPAGSTLTNTASVSGYWGDSNLSNNTATVTSEVRQPAFFGDVRAFSAGGSSGNSGGHTLAVRNDGSVWAWGLNYGGQLGDGTGSNTSNVPVLAVGLNNVAAVDAGGSHSLAVRSDGTVWGWGDNYSAQSAPSDQSRSSRSRPAQVAGLNGTFTAVAAGASHSLALRSDGTVWAWGADNFGQLGNGANVERVSAPVQVAGLGGVVAVAAGDGPFSLALKSDGTVWGWGTNQNLLLGLPAGTFSSNVPVRIGGLSDIAAISAGGWHALALKRDGTVLAWGDNNYNQLGTGTGPGTVSPPRVVPGLSSVTAISAGYQHSLALRSGGTVWSWGRNLDGVLGTGTGAGGDVPAQIGGLTATAISAGYNHSGALLAGGTVRMWGNNSAGQLGDRTNVARYAPVDVVASYGVAVPILSPDGGSFTGTQGVSFNCATPGAIIYYTTDGSEPTENSPAASPFATVFFDHSVTLKAKALKRGWPPSATKIAVFNFPAPTPTPTPAAGVAGQPIAFTRAASDGAELFVMNADGSSAVNISNSPGDDSSPTWSPDGTKIAFATRRSGDGLSHIASAAPDGSGLQIIDRHFGTSESAPSWSPDGTKIAIVSTYPVTGVANVAVIGADGSTYGVTNMTGVTSSPTWSPDGTKIAFALAPFAGRNADIFVNPSANLFFFPAQLTNDPADDVTPAWSPDGTKIAFASNRAGDYEIYVMNADGTNPQRLTTSAGADLSPAWSPGGSQIIFSSARHGASNPEIYVMNADGTNQVRLTTNTLADTSPAWRRRAPASVQFSRAAYVVSESDRSASITITRAGDASAAVSISYQTVDDLAAVRCDDNVNNHGAAYARCDYATTLDNVTFAAGETEKTFTVPLVDDSIAEGDETVRLVLSRPVGARLGAQTEAVLTIGDNDAAGGGANPIFNTDFFIRQQYLDFLSREPEPGQPWSAVLNNCPAGDATCDRVKVSAAFFGSDEFKLKGFFVFKFYWVALGRLPRYVEMTADMRAVTATTSEELFAKRNAYAASWAQRPDFRERFDALTDADYVDRLLRDAGLQQLSGAVTRETLIDDLFTARKTRAGVLRAVVEHPDVDASAFNSAFVAMQYFGYLRRDPEPGGYADWLRTINTNPADIRSMVNGFVNSQEYRLRFGQP